MALSLNALTDFESVSARLGLEDGQRALVELLINSVSDQFASLCNRRFVYEAGVVERKKTYGTTTLLLDRCPVGPIASVADIGGVSPVELDASAYQVENPDIGALFRAGGWPWSAAARPGPNFDRDPQAGTERPSVVVTYAGGFITSPQAYGASAWPGATKAVAVGRLCRPATTSQLWQASAGTTGGAEPSWTVAPALGDTVVDGSVTWTYLGTTGSAGSRGTAATLPYDLEDACARAVVSAWKSRADDQTVTSESLGSASFSYDRSKGLPPPVMAVLASYQRGA